MLILYSSVANCGGDPDLSRWRQYYIAGNDYGGKHIISNDFNEDGWADIVVATPHANFQDDLVSVLFSDTYRGFLPVNNYKCDGADLPKGITAGYFNTDDWLDIAAGNSSKCISVFLNDGPPFFPDGTYKFHLAGNYSNGPSNHGLEAADFNRDGYDDIAAANLSESAVSLLVNNGDGNFPPVFFGSGSPYDEMEINPRDAAYADFDGDEDLDLVIANGGNSYNNRISILLGDNEGKFSKATDYFIECPPNTNTFLSSIATGDFNADINSDFVALYNCDNSYYMVVFIGNGEGAFVEENDYPLNTACQMIIAKDFNKDSKSDVALICNPNPYQSGSLIVMIRRNNGKGFDYTIYPVEVQPISMVSADFNHDCVLDIAVANYFSQSVSVYIGNPNRLGSFQFVDNDYLGANPVSLRTFDINNDSHLDLVFACNSNPDSIRIMKGYGYGSFDSPDPNDIYMLLNTYFENYSSLAIGDFNGDLMIDIAVSTQTRFYILLNESDGTFRQAFEDGYFASAGDSFYSSYIKEGDYDSNGRVDLIGIHLKDAYISGRLSIFINQTSKIIP